MSIDTFYVYEHWRPDKGECFYAARHYGVAKSSVIELCLGKKHRKTVGEKVFKYEEA